MKLSEIKSVLVEARHRQDISVEKALELIQTQCSDMEFHRPFWRGSKRAAEEAYIMNGEQGGRSSANTSNHYTVLMDEFLPKLGFPKRSQSIIMTTFGGKNYAAGYAGENGLYAVFPFNGVKIGLCQTHDIWQLMFTLGNSPFARSIESWNSRFASADIPDYSYEDLVAGIKETMTNEDDDYQEDFLELFGSVKKVEKELKDAYGDPKVLGVKLVTTKSISGADHLNEKEVWISGKCVALRADVWEKLKNEAK